MAYYFKRIFGERLLIEEIEPKNRKGKLIDRLPMLVKMKNKIIVKFKKIAEKDRDRSLSRSYSTGSNRNGSGIRTIVGEDLSIYSNLTYDQYEQHTLGLHKKHASDATREVSHEEFNDDDIDWGIEDEGSEEMTPEEVANAQKINALLVTKDDVKNLSGEAKKMNQMVKPQKMKKSSSTASVVSSSAQSSATESMYNYSVDASLAELMNRNGNDGGDKEIAIHPHLSDCVVYCIGHHFSKLAQDARERIDVRHMCSLAYNAVIANINKQESKRPVLLQFTANRFLRCYPPGLHFFSANYNPIDCWNIGAQMVALNFQTSDFWMTVNHAMFMFANQGFGYIRKPLTMIHPKKGSKPLYTGKKKCEVATVQSVEINLLAARNIPRNVEIDGLSYPKVWVRK